MNKNVKKMTLGLVGLAAVATLAACGNGKSATNQVDKVKKAGVLKVKELIKKKKQYDPQIIHPLNSKLLKMVRILSWVLMWI